MRIFALLTVVAMGSAVSAEAQTSSPSSTAQSVLVAEPIAPPAVQRGKSRAAVPTGNPGDWVTTEDYPARALREDREGNTSFRVAVGLDGRPTDCQITVSSGSPDLDAATCELVASRAVFSPALNAKGRPTEGSYSSRVRWVIPKVQANFDPTDRVMTFFVETDGSATNCVERRDGSVVESTASTSSTPCSAKVEVEPYIDSSGNPVRKQVTVRFSITVTDPPK